MTRSLISALALTGAMLFAGPAFAQTVVGGATVSAEDLPKVQAACDTLAAKEQADTGVAADASVLASVEACVSAGDTDAGMDAATTTSIDLALLTYQSCKDAGLVQ